MGEFAEADKRARSIEQGKIWFAGLWRYPTFWAGLLTSPAILFFWSVVPWLNRHSTDGWDFGPASAEAIATCIAAGAAIAIPIVLARAASRDADISAMRELTERWQTFNLAVASGELSKATVLDADLAGLRPEQVKRLHAIFFRLTALHQLDYAMRRNRSYGDDFGNSMFKDVARMAAFDRTLFNLALGQRGYTEEFKLRIQNAISENTALWALPVEISVPGGL